MAARANAMLTTGTRINLSRIGTRFTALVFLGLVVLPLLALCLSWWGGADLYWRHFFATRFFGASVNTLMLALVVVAVALILGTLSALATQLLQFPGRRWLAILLPVPLVLPAYVPAFIYAGIAETPAGRLFLPGLRETWGVFFVMSLVLYPYVYLMVSAALRASGIQQIEAARVLGLSYAQAVWRVVLPSLRTALLAASALVALEVLADFGAVAVFAYDTLTTVIFSAWHGLFNLTAASQLASVLLLLAAVLLLGERRIQPNAELQQGSGVSVQRYTPTGWGRWCVPALLCLLLTFALVLPLVQLLIWSLPNLAQVPGLAWSVVQTVLLATAAAGLTLIFGGILVLGARRLRDTWATRAVQFGLLSYGVPGAVLAVGLLSLYAWVGLQGTIIGLLLAYIIRFSAPLLRTLNGAATRISMRHEEAARTLGASNLNVLRRVWLPLLASPAFLAVLLVVIEVIKEMPMTLLLRPFGWDTLAVQIYQLTSEGLWELAAIPALALLLIGALPAVWLQSLSGTRAEN